MTIPTGPPPVSLEDLGRRAIALAVLKQRIEDAVAANKRDLAGRDGLSPGDSKRVLLDDPDEPPIGNVAYTLGAAPKVAARVTSRERLLNWVIEHHPDRALLVVEPAFEQSLLNTAIANKMATTADGDIIDGIEVFQTHRGDPHITVTPAKAQLDAVWQALTATPSAVLAAIEPPTPTPTAAKDEQQ